MKKLYIILLILPTIFFSCESELDKIPSTSLTKEEMDNNPSTLDGSRLGCYSALKKENFIKVNHFFGEFGGDNIALSGSTTDNLMYIYNYQHTKTGYRTTKFWKVTYKNIVAINRVISKIDESKASKEILNTLGECYFLRGYLFFSLTNVFGRPYVQSPETNLGIPLKITTDVNDYPKRATVKKVYEQVLSDLEKAEKLMTISKENCFASKEVAQALLSRVYLYMENWTKAREYATTVIESGKYSLLDREGLGKYPTFKPKDNAETIFAITMSEDKDWPYQDNPADWGYGTIGGMYATIDGRGWGEMYASKPYRDLLNEHPEDVRNDFIDPQYEAKEDGKDRMWVEFVDEYTDDIATKQMYVTQEVYNKSGEIYTKEENPIKINIEGSEPNLKYFVYTTERSGKSDSISITGKKQYVKYERMMKTRQGYPKYFVLKCSKQNGIHNLWSPVVLRLAEMYLNRAEANAELSSGDPMSDIVKLRTRAGIKKPSEFPTGMSTIDIVMQERRLEMAFEGQRKFDIFRKGKTLNRLYPGTHDRGSGARMEIKPTDNRVVPYIPQSEIDAYLSDTPLKQNP